MTQKKKKREREGLVSSVSLRETHKNTNTANSPTVAPPTVEFLCLPQT